jgi:4-amino-4-deoxychorismate lyase
MHLLNGKNKHKLDFSDRGFQYGDGLFETIEISNGIPVFFQQHIQRLVKGCHKLLMPIPDSVLLLQEAIELSKKSNSAVLKLIYTRGSGGRGYRQPERLQPTRLFSLHPFPDYPKHFSQIGITVRFCTTRLGLNPSLAGIKHLNRLEQVVARAEWDASNIQEGLMLDMNENVVEGTMSNLFLVKDNILYTPLLEQCGIEGVLRNILIFIANDHQIRVVEKKISIQDVYSANEIFITNSIIGIWPVIQLEKVQYKIGTLTRELQKLFLIFKQRDIENAQ